eukprot:COSAG01_NODE_30207_length_618_cov_4.084453_1_plen_21_part_01
MYAASTGRLSLSLPVLPGRDP